MPLPWEGTLHTDMISIPHEVQAQILMLTDLATCRTMEEARVPMGHMITRHCGQGAAMVGPVGRVLP